ncbi:hypothetical protein BZA77DRAFT_307415 [Pyronema omphalodes]|nr:hypothetical protein BZA77DRAFT_307415 [Pyronema omphalodes]
MSDPAPPSYPHEAVPTYASTGGPDAFLESGGLALGDKKTPFPESNPNDPLSTTGPKFYFQRETIHPFRSSLILSFSSNLQECRPVYLQKHHPQHMSFLPGTSHPDITLYRGGDDGGQVVATAAVKSSLLGKTVGEVKMFNTGIELLQLRKERNKAVFEVGGRKLCWSITATQKPPVNAAEHRVSVGGGEEVTGDGKKGFKGKMKEVMDKKPETLFVCYSAKLEEGFSGEPGASKGSQETTDVEPPLAEYEDIMPNNPPMTRELIYKDGHVGLLEFKQGVAAEFVDATIAMLVLVIERAKRGISTGKSGPGYAFSPFAGSFAGTDVGVNVWGM